MLNYALEACEIKWGGWSKSNSYTYKSCSLCHLVFQSFFLFFQLFHCITMPSRAARMAQSSEIYVVAADFFRRHQILCQKMTSQSRTWLFKNVNYFFLICSLLRHPWHLDFQETHGVTLQHPAGHLLNALSSKGKNEIWKQHNTCLSPKNSHYPLP